MHFYIMGLKQRLKYLQKEGKNIYLAAN